MKYNLKERPKNWAALMENIGDVVLHVAKDSHATIYHWYVVRTADGRYGVVHHTEGGLPSWDPLAQCETVEDCNNLLSRLTDKVSWVIWGKLSSELDELRRDWRWDVPGSHLFEEEARAFVANAEPLPEAVEPEIPHPVAAPKSSSIWGRLARVGHMLKLAIFGKGVSKMTSADFSRIEQKLDGVEGLVKILAQLGSQSSPSAPVPNAGNQAEAGSGAGGEQPHLPEVRGARASTDSHQGTTEAE